VSCECLCSSHDGAGSNNPALRIGIVQAQDPTLGRLRVTFNEFDHMLSYWLPVVMPKTQNDKAYWLPDIGEQVVCLMDARDEDGVVLGAIYSHADSTPVQSVDKFHLGFKDATTFEYDRSAHVFAINFSDSSALNYDGGAHVLTVNFKDQAAIKYDAAAHVLTVSPNDGTTIKYDGSAHAFSIIGCSGASVTISAPGGVSLQSGSSYVNVNPGGVTINPPLQ
jgi:phage baseplate assembly protein gpV